MILNIIFLLPIFFAFPDLSVDRRTAKVETFVVRAGGDDSLLDDCLKSGLEASYRYEVALCHPRLFWAPSCYEERVETHSVSMDPISETYKFTWDRLGDDLGQASVGMTDIGLVKKAMRHSRPMSVRFLSNGKKTTIEHPKAFLNVRFISECRGEYNRTLSKISYYLTLGLVKVSGTDTGWSRFALAPAPESKP
jgi:hypothetical protein